MKFLYLLALAGLLLPACRTGNEGMLESAASTDLNTEDDSLAYAIGLSIGANLQTQSLDELNANLIAFGIEQQMIDSGWPKPEVENYIGTVLNERKERESAERVEAEAAELAEIAKRPGIMQTASGLLYEVVQEGTGASPGPTDQVTVHYTGTLMDGTIFDSSIKKGKPATFGVNRVIPGWTEGLQLMKEGGKMKFYIPENLGYGNRPAPGGAIPLRSSLIFDVELIAVQKSE